MKLEDAVRRDLELETSIERDTEELYRIRYESTVLADRSFTVYAEARTKAGKKISAPAIRQGVRAYEAWLLDKQEHEDKAKHTLAEHYHMARMSEKKRQEVTTVLEAIETVEDSRPSLRTTGTEELVEQAREAAQIRHEKKVEQAEKEGTEPPTFEETLAEVATNQAIERKKTREASESLQEAHGLEFVLRHGDLVGARDLLKKFARESAGMTFTTEMTELLLNDISEIEMALDIVKALVEGSDADWDEALARLGEEI